MTAPEKHLQRQSSEGGGGITTRRRYRCRFYGVSFAARPVTQAPDGALLLIHLAARHRDRVGPYLRCMEVGEDIVSVADEAYELIEGAPDGGAADGKW
jgi:hypothetical protein